MIYEKIKLENDRGENAISTARNYGLNNIDNML